MNMVDEVMKDIVERNAISGSLRERILAASNNPDHMAFVGYSRGVDTANERCPPPRDWACFKWTRVYRSLQQAEAQARSERTAFKAKEF